MSLRANDLKDLVKHVFEIDAYKSKIGSDEDIIVLSFTVDFEDPAKDLENFIEMGFDFVIDADVSPGETDDGVYIVFVEIERTRHAIDQILELLDGIERLTGDSNMRFRYYRDFKSHDATRENLEAIVPIDMENYDAITTSTQLEDYTNFFNNSYVNEISLVNESIKFKTAWGEPIKFKIVDSGSKDDMYDSIDGYIDLTESATSEIMFLTKYIGDYNITKIQDKFIFENRDYAVIMERT